MEIWDIYDKDKKLTGRTMVRDDWNMAPGDYHLTVLGVVQRPDGRYLINQRKLDKPWGAGWWEVGEETGLDLSDATVELAFTYESVSPEEKNNYFVDIYKVHLDFDDADVHTQEEEVEGHLIATAEEIRAFGEQGIFLHYSRLKPLFEET